MFSLQSRQPVQALFFIVGIFLDQVTKHISAALLASVSHYSFFGGVVRFEYVLNPYGFLSSLAVLPASVRTFLLTYGVLFLTAAGLSFLFTTRRLTTRQRTAAYLILAGGASNLLDRFLYDGGVIDFIQLGFGFLQTGIFNLADVYILCGSFYLGYSYALRRFPATSVDG